MVSRTSVATRTSWPEFIEEYTRRLLGVGVKPEHIAIVDRGHIRYWFDQGESPMVSAAYDFPAHAEALHRAEERPSMKLACGCDVGIGIEMVQPCKTHDPRTLRDDFAAQALAGLCARPPVVDEGETEYPEPDDIARQADAIAVAMMAIRAEQS